MGDSEQTHYDALGIEADATDKDIKKAYRKLAMRFHPDKDPSPGAAVRFGRIQRAYDVLSDPIQRRKYDDALAAGHSDVADECDDNPDRTTELMRAAQSGDLEQVSSLLARGSRVDETDAFDRSALMYAASAAQPEAVQVLLDAGASISLADSEGMTPFLDACGGHRRILEMKKGTLKCLKVLLDAKANVNDASLKGYTGLSLAVNGSSLAVASFLLTNKAEPDQSSHYCMTPLCVAAHRGNVKMMELLIKHKADPNRAAESDGETALMVAAGAGHVAAVQTLIDAGANAKHFSKDGGSALLSVVEELTEGHIDSKEAEGVVKLLLKHDADPTAGTIDGRWPLKMAARNTAQGGRGVWLEDLLSTAASRQQTQGASCKDCLAGLKIMFS